MQLGVNYAALVRGQNFLQTLDLREATLSLPVDPEKPAGARVEIARLNARLFLPPQQIYVARAEAEILGIQVSVSGRLLNPQIFWEQKAEGAAPGDLAARIVEEIQSLTFEAGPPVISLKFSGDLAEPEKFVVDLAVWAERIRRRELRAAKSLRRGRLSRGRGRSQAVHRHRCHGHAAAQTGRIEPGTRRAEFHLRSGLDLPALASEWRLAPQLAEFVFYGAPSLDVTASATLGEKPEFSVFGHLGLGRFAYRSVLFEGLDADLSWDGLRWSARDVQLRHRTRRDPRRRDAGAGGNPRAALEHHQSQSPPAAPLRPGARSHARV